MNFFVNISWITFLSVAIPCYLVAIILVWLYYSKLYKSKEGKKKSDVSRFAPTAVTDDDIPDEDEGFISVESDEDVSDDVINDMVSTIEEEQQRVTIDEIVVDAKDDDGVVKEFDQPQEFDIECEVEDMEEQHKRFLEYHISQNMKQDYVDTGRPCADEDTFISKEENAYGGMDDFLMLQTEMSYNAMTAEEKEQVDLAKMANLAENMDDGEGSNSPMGIENFSQYFGDAEEEGQKDEENTPAVEDDFSKGYISEEDMFGEKPEE